MYLDDFDLHHDDNSVKFTSYGQLKDVLKAYIATVRCNIVLVLLLICVVLQCNDISDIPVNVCLQESIYGIQTVWNYSQQ